MACRSSGDSIFVDGEFVTSRARELNEQFLVAALNEHGDLYGTKFLPIGIRSVSDLCVYDCGMYITGLYGDTVRWDSEYSSPEGLRSIYIATLNTELDLVDFKDLSSNASTHPTSLNISDKYGIVLSGYFDGEFKLYSSSMELDNIYFRSSFIASLDDAFVLRDCKIIRGSYYNLRRIEIHNDTIIGAAVFRQYVQFHEQTNFGVNNDVSVFQTTDIDQLPSFDLCPTFVSPTIPFSVSINPNPFSDLMTIRFSEPVSFVDIRLTNSTGQLCRVTFVGHNEEMEMVIDANGLSSGLYILNITTGSGHSVVRKVVRMN